MIAVDICADIDSNRYPMASREDLDQTASLVEKHGGRVVTRVADVRDRAALAAPTLEDVLPAFPAMTATGDPYIEPEDVADTVVFLLSDQSKFVTGMQMRVDAGGYVKLRPQPPAF